MVCPGPHTLITNLSYLKHDSRVSEGHEDQGMRVDGRVGIDGETGQWEKKTDNVKSMTLCEYGVGSKLAYIVSRVNNKSIFFLHFFKLIDRMLTAAHSRTNIHSKVKRQRPFQFLGLVLLAI